MSVSLLWLLFQCHRFLVFGNAAQTTMWSLAWPVRSNLSAMVVTGAGWQRYNRITDGANTSSLSSTDDILAIPLGIGMSLGVSGLTFDARATYRRALGSDLFGTQTSSFDDASMNSWGAGGSVGFEF